MDPKFTYDIQLLNTNSLLSMILNPLVASCGLKLSNKGQTFYKKAWIGSWNTPTSNGSFKKLLLLPFLGKIQRVKAHFSNYVLTLPCESVVLQGRQAPGYQGEQVLVGIGTG
jgi:hypothetical protein